MKIKLSILQTIRTILDVLIIFAIFIDLIVNGLSNWLLIIFILFIPSNLLYFAIRKHTIKSHNKSKIRKTVKKDEKALVITH